MRKNILVAFLLNLCFSVFELVGGFVTGSVAIMSDSLHDFGDALSIGLAVILEKKSQKAPDEYHTYGYARYSVLGGVVTTVILILGSVLVFLGSVKRILTPVEINYNGMIVFAVIGVIVNLAATLVTSRGHGLNEKAVNLHMLEDVLGWVVVLIGSIVMKFTDISVLDPILSMGVAVFILIAALKNLKDALNVFLNKAPKDIGAEAVKKVISEIEGVADVHHIHIFSLDGINNIASLHIVTEESPADIKLKVKQRLEHLGVYHTTVEIESLWENCNQTDCCLPKNQGHSHHCHHHH